MTRPRGRMKGESDLSYALSMLNFYRHPMNRRMAGDNKRVKAAEKRVLELGGKIPLPKKRSPRRSFKDTLLEAQMNAAKSNQPNIKSNLSMQEQIDRQNKLYQQYLKDKKMVAPPRKGPVQRMPQRPSTLGKLFKGASTKPEGGFLKALGDSPMTGIIKQPRKPPTDTQIKQNQHNRKKAELTGIDTSSAIVRSRKKVKRQPSVTSQYRGGSGKKKYNQATYFAGLGVNPNTKQNQGIYKPYANGGGVRKPKYKE